MMKAITGKMIISLVGVAVATPFFAIALLAGAHAVELAQNAQDEALLVILAFSGAVISMINGFGRRQSKAASASRRADEREGKAASRGTSVVNLGY